jgi:hypothetical protein
MTARLLASRQTLLERVSPVLGKQTNVVDAEVGALDYGAFARPTVTQDRSAARKLAHEEIVTRTYVRARARGRVQAFRPGLDSE